MAQRQRKSRQKSSEQRHSKPAKEQEDRKYGDVPGNQTPNTPQKKESEQR